MCGVGLACYGANLYFLILLKQQNDVFFVHFTNKMMHRKLYLAYSMISIISGYLYF